jgi:hypothetical protein
MKINKLIYRNTQKSILCNERSELIALFEVDHEGQQGHLLYEATFDKCDTDSECYCDIESVAIDTITNDGIVVNALEIDVWEMEQEYDWSENGPIFLDEIEELITALRDKPVG